MSSIENNNRDIKSKYKAVIVGGLIVVIIILSIIIAVSTRKDSNDKEKNNTESTQNAVVDTEHVIAYGTNDGDAIGDNNTTETATVTEENTKENNSKDISSDKLMSDEAIQKLENAKNITIMKSKIIGKDSSNGMDHSDSTEYIYETSFDIGTDNDKITVYNSGDSTSFETLFGTKYNGENAYAILAKLVGDMGITDSLLDNIKLDNNNSNLNSLVYIYSTTEESDKAKEMLSEIQCDKLKDLKIEIRKEKYTENTYIPCYFKTVVTSSDKDGNKVTNTEEVTVLINQ